MLISRADWKTFPQERCADRESVKVRTSNRSVYPELWGAVGVLPHLSQRGRGEYDLGARVEEGIVKVHCRSDLSNTALNWLSCGQSLGYCLR